MYIQGSTSEVLLKKKFPSVKKRFKRLGTLLVAAYLLLPFFQDLPDEWPPQVQACSAVLLTIPTTVYWCLETVIAVCLIICRHKLQKLPTQKIITWRFILSLFIFFVILMSNLLTPLRVISLNLRVPLLLCCSPALQHLVRVFLMTIYSNIWYYGLMWVSIGMFWASGNLLFGGEKLSGQNIFQSPLDAIWSLLVLQSTATFPDLSLPFVKINFGSILFFVVFLFCHTIIVSNIIVANSYATEKEAREEYELTKGLPKVLRQVLRQKKKLMQEIAAFKKMSSRSRVLREVVNHQLYKVNEWILNVVMFLIVCFFPAREFPNSLLKVMVVFTMVLSISPIVRSTTIPLKFVLQRTFLVYDLIVVIITLFVSLFILADDHRFSYIYPYFALLRIPHILKPLLQFLFKDWLKSPLYTSRTSSAVILIHHWITPQLLSSFYSLFLVTLQFSSIGMALFSSVLSTSTVPTLVSHGLNPDYIYINFNTTVNSFLTLFSLLMLNNWSLLVEMYVVVTGNRWVRAYFVCFFMFGVLVAYNIVVASIIQCIVNLAQMKNKGKNTKEEENLMEDSSERENLKRYIEQEIEGIRESEVEL